MVLWYVIRQIFTKEHGVIFQMNVILILPWLLYRGT